jgi:hypothetical protein
MEKSQISILFSKDYKTYTTCFDKKTKDDYVLNVTKIIKDKFNTKFIVPNKVQLFLLNYEIKKLLDKAVSAKTKKYKNVIYLNSNLSTYSLLNSISFIQNEYPTIDFKLHLVTNFEIDDFDHSQFKDIPLIIVSTNKKSQLI